MLWKQQSTFPSLNWLGCFIRQSGFNQLSSFWVEECIKISGRLTLFLPPIQCVFLSKSSMVFQQKSGRGRISNYEKCYFLTRSLSESKISENSDYFTVKHKKDSFDPFIWPHLNKFINAEWNNTQKTKDTVYIIKSQISTVAAIYTHFLHC